MEPSPTTVTARESQVATVDETSIRRLNPASSRATILLTDIEGELMISGGAWDK